MRVGDVVWFWPDTGRDLLLSDETGYVFGQVAKVGKDESGATVVNLVVTSSDGLQDRRIGVPVGSDQGRPYCEPRPEEVPDTVAADFAAWAGV